MAELGSSKGMDCRSHSGQKPMQFIVRPLRFLHKEHSYLNHRVIQAVRDVWRFLVQLMVKVRSDQVSPPGFIQSSLEHIKGWKLHSLWESCSTA